MLEIDEGYDFEVVVVDDEWVFRFPRRSGVEEALELEILLLPLIAPALPVGVPSFEHVSRDPLFVGYRLIRGEPLVDEDPDGRPCVPRRAARARSVRASRGASGLGRGLPRPVREFERLVFPRLDPDLRARGKRLFGDVETLVGFTPALLHADLGPAHLLVSGGRLVGVIDWGDTRVGDPALDYAWLLNGPFAGWDVDPDLRRRARFYHRLGPWYEAHYGLFTNQPAHTSDRPRGDRGAALNHLSAGFTR